MNKLAAARAVQALTQAPDAAADNPRAGKQVAQFEPREVRRILVGQNETRHEFEGKTIYVLRIWHTREDR